MEPIRLLRHVGQLTEPGLAAVDQLSDGDHFNAGLECLVVKGGSGAGLAHKLRNGPINSDLSTIYWLGLELVCSRKYS